MDCGDAVLEGIIRVKDDGGFTGDEGSAGDNGNELSGLGKGKERSFENGADDAGLTPDFTFGKFSAGSEAGEFCAGAGAAGGAVVFLAGAEDEVLRIGVEPFFRCGEGLNVIDFTAIGSGDVLCFEGVADGTGELCEGFNVLGANGGALVGDEEEPIASPSDVSGDDTPVRNGDFDVLGGAIGGDVFCCYRVVLVKGGGDDADGSFNAVLSGFDAAKVGEGFDDPDGAVEAAVKIGAIVEEDDSGDAGGIVRFAEACADHGAKSTGLVDEGGSDPVGLLGEELVGGDGSFGKVDAGDDGPGRFAAGVGVDDLHCWFLVEGGEFWLRSSG